LGKLKEIRGKLAQGLTRHTENRLRSHFGADGYKGEPQRACVTRIDELEFLLNFGSYQRGNEV
jgi:hypothetical protein